MHLRMSSQLEPRELPSVCATEIKVLMQSMFFDFISETEELAVSKVNLARACTKAFLSSSRWKMQAILMAHLIPSKQRRDISGSSQSWRPTEKAARRGVHANLNIGLTCSWSVAVVKDNFTWLADSMRTLAVCEMLSSSIFHNTCFLRGSNFVPSLACCKVFPSLPPPFILISLSAISS